MDIKWCEELWCSLPVFMWALGSSLMIFDVIVIWTNVPASKYGIEGNTEVWDLITC